MDCGFLSSAQNLIAAADGSAWIRRSEYEDLGDETFYHPPRKLMTHVGVDGALLGDLTIPDSVVNVVTHPSGELTFVGWEKSPEKTAVVLRRVRPDGSLISERLLRNEIPPEQRWHYGASADGAVRRRVLSEEARYLSVLGAVPHGEDVYLLTSMDGLRLVRIDPQLQTRWMTLVTPSVEFIVDTLEEQTALGVPFNGWALTVSPSGEVLLASPFLPAHRSAYLDTFDQSPEGTSEGRGILLIRVSDTGQIQQARAIAAEHVELIVGLALQDGAFAVGAQAKTPVSGQRDKPTDTDVFFASGRMDRPASETVTRVIAFDRDDGLSSIAPCGGARFCLAGHTGYVDLTSGRTPDNGRGFVVTVDAQGVKDPLIIEGPRDTEVVSAVPAPDGSLLFVYTTNGAANPARVADFLKNNELWLGRLSGAP